MRLAITLFCASALFGQTVEVKTEKVWTDSGIDLRPGDNLRVTAEGTLQLPQNKSCGPEGANRGFRDLLKAFPVNEVGLGALIGRIGSSDAALPFAIGKTKEFAIHRAGRLFLGINFINEKLGGSFQVKVEFVSRGPEKPVEPTNLRLPEVTTEIVDRIPRRVVDMDGNPGDNTNFIIAGKEKDVIDAFTAAGWVKVDRDTKSAVITALFETLSKEAYVSMPMSILTLFGRPQDYGLAHAEPIAVVAQRHHLRLWKVPQSITSDELWVGAATHDIGFDRDNRPGRTITHRIDPDVDLERDYVSRSLEETGLVAKTTFLQPTDPSKEARTATGASFHSDGRVLVIYLIPQNQQ